MLRYDDEISKGKKIKYPIIALNLRKELGYSLFNKILTIKIKSIIVNPISE